MINKNWLKISQKLFTFCIVFGVLVVVVAMISPSNDGNESLGFAIYLIGFPALVLLSLLNIIGSFVNIKTLSKSDWAYLIISLLLLIGSAVIVFNFFN